MKRRFQHALALVALAAAASASAQITLYQGEDFRGRAFSTDREVRDLGRLGRQGLEDRASSIVVERGRWEVCSEPRFQGRCVVLRRGNYPSLDRLDMGNRISSLRPADDRRRYERELEPSRDERADDRWRRRAEERVFEADVTSVRAVMGPPTQRCWIERQQVGSTGNANVGGAIAGAVIGGILGHQVGGGSGKDVATAGGAAVGAVIGSNMGGGAPQPITQDVQRCRAEQSGPPAYYDVTYNFRGRTHQVQMSAPPGRTIVVNRDGEPRH